MNSWLSKLHWPFSQSTNRSRLRRTESSSILFLVLPSPKIWQPSGMVWRAARSSSRVQLIRSPTTLGSPAAVAMVKLSKTW